jgi:hypothetical protein
MASRRNQSTPWVTEALNARRENLFIAALALHRAFIDAAASRILHNLGALQVSSMGMQKNEERCRLLGDLWSTLFLVVPVLSTTFTSVARMLGNLPPNTLGWLLIDEAGQATPQAAMGRRTSGSIPINRGTTEEDCCAGPRIGCSADETLSGWKVR